MSEAAVGHPLNEFVHVELVATIVAAYVTKNALQPSDLPALIADVHAALLAVAGAPMEPIAAELPKPAVSVRKSIGEDYIVCLEDGRKFKSLKRHLRAQYDMSPEQYRAKWNLPVDYPMVAPSYARARSTLAKEMGLGQQRRR